MSSIKCGTHIEYRCGRGVNPIHHLTKTNRSLISCTDGGALQKFRFNPGENILHKFWRFQ